MAMCEPKYRHYVGYKMYIFKKGSKLEPGNYRPVSYSYVRSKCKTKDVIGPLKDDKNVLVMDDCGMSQMLNNYFSSVFTREPVNFNLDLLQVEHIYKGDQQNKPLDVVISY